MPRKDMAPTFGKVGSVSKVDKFGWSIKDQPGIFMNIEKTSLNVAGGAAGYQRKEIHSKCVNMAREWSWVGCGCLVVAMRPDGSFWIMDGQHRKGAAMLRSDITELPCLVFEVSEIKEEARGLEQLNINRKPFGSHDRFRVALVRGDAFALEAIRLAQQVGRTIRPGADAASIDCVGAMMNCITDNLPAFQNIWPICDQVCAGEGIHGDIVKGLFYIEKRAQQANDTISSPYWRDRILAVGLKGLLARARSMRDALGAGGERATALGFVAAIKPRNSRKVPGFEEDV